MGTKLPLYGYIDPDATGVKALEDNDFRPIPTRGQQRNALDGFLNYLSRPDVQSLAYSLILDEFDASREVWCRGVVREEGGETRTNLLQLLETIRGRGTIVVPTVDDLVEHKSREVAHALKRILKDKVTVLAVYDRESPLCFFTEANQRADDRVFSAMAANVLSVRTTLEAVSNNRKKWRF
jgi:hypothetical protein